MFHKYHLRINVWNILWCLEENKNEAVCLTRRNKNDMIEPSGELSEWFKEPVLKTGDSARNLGFESLTLRQKRGPPIGWSSFWLRVGIRRGRPHRRWGKKHAGGMFFRPGENPYPHERIRYGCGYEDIIRCRIESKSDI